MHRTVGLIVLDVLQRALRVAHGPLDDEPPPTDGSTVVWAAEVIACIRPLRHALHRYRAAILRALRPPKFHNDHDLPF